MIKTVEELTKDILYHTRNFWHGTNRKEFGDWARLIAKRVREALEDGIDPKGSALLFAVCRIQDVALIKELIRFEGGNIRALELQHNQYSLQEFMKTKCNPQDLEILFQAGAVMDRTNGQHSFNFGKYILTSQFNAEIFPMADMAMKYGFDFGLPEGTSTSPFRYALNNGPAEVIEFLTSRGAFQNEDPELLAAMLKKIKTEEPSHYLAYEVGLMNFAATQSTVSPGGVAPTPRTRVRL